MPTLLALAAAAVAAPPSPEDAIRAAVTTFGEAAATRDVDALRAVLDPAAVQHVRREGRWSALPTPTYLDLMAAGKIGGDPVTVDVVRVAHDGPVATVGAVRTTRVARFDDTLTLVEEAGQWRIVGAVVLVSAAAP